MRNATRIAPSQIILRDALEWPMPPNQVVEEFIRQTKEMLRVLRSDGHEFSDIDLHRLMTHLHLLEIESSNLQTLKKLQSIDRAA